MNILCYSLCIGLLSSFTCSARGKDISCAIIDRNILPVNVFFYIDCCSTVKFLLDICQRIWKFAAFRAKTEELRVFYVVSHIGNRELKLNIL